jgi:hypothetical protein
MFLAVFARIVARIRIGIRFEGAWTTGIEVVALVVKSARK